MREEGRSDAVMDAETEAQMAVVGPCDDEPLRVLELARVVVGRRQYKEQVGVCRDCACRQLDVLERQAGSNGMPDQTDETNTRLWWNLGSWLGDRLSHLRPECDRHVLAVIARAGQ